MANGMCGMLYGVGTTLLYVLSDLRKQTESTSSLTNICEIKTASEQITELLDSLRELSREESSISPRAAAIDQTIATVSMVANFCSFSLSKTA
jgi:hypothetical protein